MPSASTCWPSFSQPLILACAGFGVSKFLMTPKYQASALMIVNTRQDTTSNVTSDQINSATKLVSTYSIIIKSDTVLQQVINNLGLSLTYPRAGWARDRQRRGRHSGHEGHRHQRQPRVGASGL